MKQKLLYLFGLFFFASLVSNAQIITFTPNGNSGNVLIGGSTNHVSEHIYLASEIGAGNFESPATAINAISVGINAVSTATFPVSITNYKIYMQNIPAGTTIFTTGTYSLTGYTEVFNGTLTLNGIGWNNVTLNTPFQRTPGSNLQVLFVKDNGIASTGIASDCAIGNAVAGTGTAVTSSRRYNGTVTPAENSTSLTASNFRAAIQLKKTYPNDVAINNVYPLGVNGQGLPNVVRAHIANVGTNVRTNVQVTLNVTGANTFTSTLTIPTLNAGQGGFLTFPAYTSSNLGSNTVTVSVAAGDDFAGNDSKAETQEITTNKLSYAIGTTSNVSVNAGAGNEIACKYVVPYANAVSQVEAYFGVAGNTYDVNIYSNVSGVPGSLLGSVTGQTSTVGLNTINFLTPISVNDSFYVSIKQTGAALNISYQPENPCRSNAFFLKSGANPWFDLGANPANTFRLMIGVTTSAALPVTLNNFNAQLRNTSALLTWNTVNEVNLAAYVVERNTNGDWATVATIAPKGNASNSYSTTDAGLTNGKHLYRLKMMDKDGKFTYSNVITLEVSSRSLFVLNQNYPNPVKGSTQLSYQLTGEGKVVIDLFTQDGRRVASLVNQQQAAGTYSFSVDIKKFGLATGNYNYRMIVVDKNNQELFRATKTMVV
nr:hypothetical protein [Chitinophagaceae bacterium]